ncbi:hypothetical protein TanjilG_27429 [Lupinus angustifolius]|uniref:Uncharacterized protein n=1 Tax=Lupinus angustifolius TaxID=3871 RepID=A0A1J7G459_LUPAN|nr:hypothetical protein TanjilG_27429 [Lupinus angustifolius]
MASSCENKSTQNLVMFSDSEIEAAEQLIQLSSGDSSVEDHHSSNNSCSYSVNNNMVDSYDVESSIAATTTESVEDKGFVRKKEEEDQVPLYRRFIFRYNICA